MYGNIIKNKVRKSFDLVNEHSYAELVGTMASDVRHSFAGNHALGGTRNNKASVQQWLERLGRVMPNLKVTVINIVVKGWPHNTLAIVRWRVDATLQNGKPYQNRGAHFITLHWGKVKSIEVYEDSQAVAAAMEQQFTEGIEEAKAAPIVS